MKISKETIAILKNFATINGNLLIKPGNTLSTLSASKSVYASVQVKEDFPCQFGIYDLNELLGIASSYGDPDFEFSEKSVLIKEGRNSVRYNSASEDVLVAPSKAIKVPPADVEWNMTADQINMIIKIAGVIRAPDITFEGKDGELLAIVGDKKNSSASTNITELGSCDSTFRAHIRVDNLKVIPGDYKVEIAGKKVVKMTAGSLEYVLVLEQDSQFED